MQLRQTIVWILAFLIAPLLILTIQIFPNFASVAIRTVRWHAAFVAGMVVTLVELAVLSLDRVPFTRPYAAGDGLLRKRWPLYLFGMFAFAYWPVRIELQLLGGGEPWLVAGAAGAAIACHLVGRARAHRWSVTLDEPVSDGAMISVLDIGAVVRPVAPFMSTPSAS